MSHDPQEANPLECPQKETAGIDWYRTILEEPDRVEAARAMAVELQRRDAEGGEKVGPWSFQGYEGMMSPSIRWGINREKMLWETSGAVASYTLAPMRSFTGRTTRIDLQVTAEFLKPVPAFGTQCMRLEEMTHHHLPPSHRRIGFSTLNRGSWCGTVGKRTRPRFFRLYDKGVESRTAAPNVKWRLELEAKYDFARQLDAELLCQSDVPRWAYKRLVPLWKSSGFTWPSDEDDEPLGALLPVDPPLPSLFDQLEWIERTVKPVVSRMKMVCSPTELLRTLGLEDVAMDRKANETLRHQARMALVRRANMADHVSVAYQGALGADATGGNRRRPAPTGQ